MAIIQQPASISLLGNMLPFLINTTDIVNFTLSDGDTTLLEATYEPSSSGRVIIDVKDIIENRLKYTLKGDAFYEQTEIVKGFTALVDGQTVNFRVIRTSVYELADTPNNWLTDNWLTWQPQSKLVSYYSPEWLTYYAAQACTIKLKAHFYGNTDQTISLGSCSAGKAFTINVQYAHIAGLLADLYPTYYDVWAETPSGHRLNYIQRFCFSDVASEQEQWISFENSLGGLDNLRATGETDLNIENEHKVATIDGEITEYKVNTKRIYTKNTGHLTDYERRWLLDFPPSRAKYIHHNGAIRHIAVIETDFRYAVSDSPTNYSFKYRFVNQSSALNLPRSENLIPSSITIPDIDAPGFFLPPRLSEYPRVVLGEGTIIPAFDPNNETPTVTTVGALSDHIVAKTLPLLPGWADGGRMVQVLTSDAVLGATETNVLSALATLQAIQESIGESIGDIDFSSYLTKTAFNNFFEWDAVNNAIKAKFSLYSVGELSSYNYGETEVPGALTSVDWEDVENRPTKLSDFSNDLGFITASALTSKLNTSLFDSHANNATGVKHLTSSELTSLQSFITNGVGSGSWNDLNDKPTKLSDFSNDIGFITASALTSKLNTSLFDSHANNATGVKHLTSSELTSLQSFITNGVGSGSWNDLNDKPTKLSDFSNDIGFITASALTSKLNTSLFDSHANNATGVKHLTSSELASLQSFITNGVGSGSWNDLDDRPTALSYFSNDLGFVTASHTHTKAQVSDFAHKHLKVDITDFSHTHLKSDVGLSNVTNESKATMFTDPVLTGITTIAKLALGTGWTFVRAGNNIEWQYNNVTKQIFSSDGGIIASGELSSYGAGATESMIIDNLTSTSTDSMLSSNMGRELNVIKLNSEIANIDYNGDFVNWKGTKMTGCDLTGGNEYKIYHTIGNYKYMVNVSVNGTQTFAVAYFSNYFTVKLYSGGSLTTDDFKVQLIY